jgi:hypothetical protein
MENNEFDPFSVFKKLFDDTQDSVAIILRAPALVITLPPNTHLDPGIPYSFRVLVENPSITFADINERNRWWRIETRLKRSGGTGEVRGKN